MAYYILIYACCAVLTMLLCMWYAVCTKSSIMHAWNDSDRIIGVSAVAGVIWPITWAYAAMHATLNIMIDVAFSNKPKKERVNEG
jgi:hypothetical protein